MSPERWVRTSTGDGVAIPGVSSFIFIFSPFPPRAFGAFRSFSILDTLPS